jgi:hypothetical protein
VRGSTRSTPVVADESVDGKAVQPEKTGMWMTVGDRRFVITLVKASAAHALRRNCR